MTANINKLQQEIRSVIFETVTSKPNYQMTDLLKELSLRITTSLNTNLTAIYTYNKWKKIFILQGADEKGKTVLPSQLCADKNSYDSIERSRKDLSKNLSAQTSSYLKPIGNETSILGYLFLVFNKQELKEEVKSELSLVTDDLHALLNRHEKITEANNKAVKYEYLYKAISNLHSSMNSKTILQEVHAIIKQEYPDFECMFYLIQDFTGSEELPTKELSYENNSDQEVCLRTLIREEVQIEKIAELNKTAIYLPLKGKQGVYGVLQLTALSEVVFPKEEIDFLTTLAYTAGNAMENAELYQQSRQMIADLQLINEASHSLNLNLRMNEITTFMKELFHKTFNVCEIGFINFISETEELQILEGSTTYFHTSEGKTMINILSSRINHQKGALFISETSEEAGLSFPAWQSIIAVPMVQLNQIRGIIILLHPDKHHFPFRSFELIQSLVHHSTLAFANSLLREELEIAVITDYLSGLYTRKYLDEQISIELNKGEMGAFLLIDIDDFKKINDTFGHEIGDNTIVQVADVLKASISYNDIAARWGGEELAVYMPDSTLDEGLKAADKLVKKMRRITHPAVTVSIGVSNWDKTKKSNPDSLFQRADKALYKAKNKGKNRVCTL